MHFIHQQQRFLKRKNMSIDAKKLKLVLFLIGTLFSVHSNADGKTDVVILLNGDAVTGEIKALDFGTLRYSTDSMGTVSIDWEDIVSVTSEQNLEIVIIDGSKYYGRLLQPEHEATVLVKTASQELSLPAEQIVRITPIETSEKFWQRLEGSFSFGFQAQKSSGVSSSNATADVSYRTRKYLVGLQINSTITDQTITNEEMEEETVTTARQSMEVNYQRFRPNRWFTDWFTRWEKNDELGISGRNSIGGALGRYFLQTNRNQFSLTAGLQSANTSFTDELEESTTEAEGRIEIRYLHRSLIPESSLTFTSKIYPLIKDLSQFRAETDIVFRREFVKDLFWDITIGHSYLSDPPADGSTSDHTVTTSIGYKF
jgi:hypothetical protein